MNTSTSAASSRNAEGSSTTRINLLALGALIAPWLAAWLLPSFAQPQSYHDYADQRAWLGLSHAADVLSNLPFLVVGALGLHFVLHGWRTRNHDAFSDQREAWPYALLFVGPRGTRKTSTARILAKMVEQGIGPQDIAVYGCDGNMGNALGEDFDAGE